MEFLLKCEVSGQSLSFSAPLEPTAIRDVLLSFDAARPHLFGMSVTLAECFAQAICREPEHPACYGETLTLVAGE